MNTILLDHGSGGGLTSELISNLFARYFNNDILLQMGDSAILPNLNEQLAFTTDSYVVQPIFFPGGNIGKLAVCGTINDLAVSGAKPLYLSCGMIIEEGFSLDKLEEIVSTMAHEAAQAGVLLVTGDTKVVEKGACDQIFINTAGIGKVNPKHIEIVTGKNIIPGDKILLNGPIGNHGMAILKERKSLPFEAPLQTDCQALNKVINEMLSYTEQIHFMRDATRGGIATVLTEIAEQKNYGISIAEQQIPVDKSVAGFCEFLGFDPLYVANEGKFIAIVANGVADELIQIMKKYPGCEKSCIIGEVTEKSQGKAILQTSIGGRRYLQKLNGFQLPRIC
ncbi:MAG: hydrogenase expression/formation protein HypE [Spirochaetes bacterium]|nr:hydrogenase expression/formation protein HypE [Spirochaetota bacterium]